MTILTHLYELIRRRAERYPTAVALGGQEGLRWKTLDSQQALELVDRLAVELAALGVGAGDRVVYWVPNQWRTPLYFFATWKLGAIVVPFDREMNPEGGARILETIEPKAVIVGYGERPAWSRGIEVVEWWEPGSRLTLKEPSTGWERPTETLAVVAFTSGTTGTPKGCMITQANLLSQVAAIRERIPLDPSCRLASLLPLSHLLELTGFLHALDSGAATHYVPSRRAPDIVRVLSEQRITHMVVVPQVLTIMGRAIETQLVDSLPAPICRAMYAAADRLPLAARRAVFWPVHHRLGGRLRLFLSGGAALPPATQRQWERLGVRVIEGYGASECSPVITLGEPDGNTPPGSVGRPISGVSVKLSPDGELLVSGPNVMRGYWKDPTRTEEVLRDGWYATGDLGTIDPDGNVRVTGRAKDLIVLPSGLKVWPEDVEDVLRTHPAVKDAAVLAVPTPGGGATLHAYLLPAQPAERGVDLGALVAACNGRLAIHQRLATASWWPAGADFPRTSLLKVKRHLLPDPQSGAVVEVASIQSADDPVGLAVAGAAHLPAVRDDQVLGQLGLDSLGLVDLALALEEKTGKAVGDGDLRLEMSVAEVREVLGSAPALEVGQQAVQQRGISGEPLWPYTWGRAFRVLGFPIDLLYRLSVTRTIVLGREHLRDLPPRVILAGTHRSFPDTPLVRRALAMCGGRKLAGRLVPAIVANPDFSGGYGWYGVLALGLHSIKQTSEREASLRSLARVADAGNAILIFPQGIHARPEQELSGDPAARFRPGVGHLATALAAAVVPFGLAGTAALVPPSAEGLKVPTIAGIPVKITRGPLAIAFAASMRPESGEAPQAFAARLQEVCFRLSRQAEQALELERSTRLGALV